MSSAVQREDTAGEYLATGTEGTSILRQVAAERLAAHRSRRAVVEGRAAQTQAAAQAAVRLQARRDAAARQPEDATASRVRDAVAARYRESQSYREFLAIEAQRALEQAQAEAEVAARSAQAVVQAQRQLLEEIEQWNQPRTSTDTEPAPPVLAVVEPQAARKARAAKTVEPPQPVRLQVRLHEELGPVPPPATSFTPARMVAGADEELADLEEEIEFRRAPEFDDLVLETLPIHANIIEFPRELVASRKVRPRLAEGPLLEETATPPQLRIFEVEPELITSEPEVAAGPAAPEWQSLRLSSGTAAQTQERTSLLDASDYFDHWLEPVIHAAPLSRRALSTAIDTAVLLAGLAGAAAIAAKIVGDTLRSAPLPLLAASAVAALVVFAALYKLLFFTLNDATPGMRLARVAFCTFDEESPTRSAVRRRLFATVLAACPLGMGLLWTVLDSDKLGWHDRMSRMYPRSY
jgi:hypothetical protein